MDSNIQKFSHNMKLMDAPPKFLGLLIDFPYGCPLPKILGLLMDSP
jgi:hypothetical protein